MKKTLLISLICLTVGFPAMAGGILTNTNQSAKYIRLLANDASLDIDAVYYNPAGLSFLSEGFHISINNQSIFQNKEIMRPTKPENLFFRLVLIQLVAVVEPSF